MVIFAVIFAIFACGIKKTEIYIYFNLSNEYSLPCFPLRLRAYEFFSRRTQEDAREGPE